MPAKAVSLRWSAAFLAPAPALVQVAVVALLLPLLVLLLLQLPPWQPSQVVLSIISHQHRHSIPGERQDLSV